MVERQPSKLNVVGSSPISRYVTQPKKSALIAQMAERILGKDEVSGSIPDLGSIDVEVQ